MIKKFIDLYRDLSAIAPCIEQIRILNDRLSAVEARNDKLQIELHGVLARRREEDINNLKAIASLNAKVKLLERQLNEANLEIIVLQEQLAAYQNGE